MLQLQHHTEQIGKIGTFTGMNIFSWLGRIPVSSETNKFFFAKIVLAQSSPFFCCNRLLTVYALP